MANLVDFNTWAYATGASRQDPQSMRNYQTYLNSNGSQFGIPNPEYPYRDPVPAAAPAAAAPAVNTPDPYKEYAKQILDDPQAYFQEHGMSLSDKIPTIDANAEGTNLDPTDQKYQVDTDALNQSAQTVDQTAQAAQVDSRQTATYDAAQAAQDVDAAGMTAAQGTVSQGAQIDAPQIDVEQTAAGGNALGQALNDYASQDLNTVDPKATVKGQLEILQDEFVDAEGKPTVPAWASGIARSVSKIAAFKGMTGTAATETMSNALMEASISVATQDAQFFQTLTLANLSNEQASTINKANVLANISLANMDAQLAAAVQNSKAFLEMDLANLNNEQQAQVINTQSRVQAILEDANRENASRLFTAQSQNEFDKFYDNLNAQISQYNASQTNQMAQYNTQSENAMRQFNASLENQRESFYREMQYNIDLANAKWRQQVTVTEAGMAFDAAAADVKNMVGLSAEQLNRLWDRADSLLDYAWKSTESELNRQVTLATAKISADARISVADAQLQAADAAGLGSVFGSIAGNILGDIFS